MSKPNCVEMDVKYKDKVIIVGDMHGCFETLIRLFEGDQTSGVQPLGYPGASAMQRNVYFFNGDFVDRGGSGYQIVFTLAMFVLVEPSCIYLNRGNHESENFGLSAGQPSCLISEIQKKFPSADITQCTQALTTFFTALPICHILDKNTFIVHGGVPRANSLEGINQQMGAQNLQFVELPPNATPFPLDRLDIINPSRFDTVNLKF